MGHDEHFLTRLDRVTPPEVELALTLYRDHELVSWILRRARVPDAIDRIAIALTRDDASPHVIVARNGHFVTCLGRGMAVGDRMVITRARLDALIGEFTELRTRLDELQRKHVSPFHLFGRLINGGNQFSREDFESIAPLEPLIRGYALSELWRAIQAQQHVLPTVVEALRKRNHRIPREELLYTYWQLAHTIGNFTVLVGMAGPEAAHLLTESKAAGESLGRAITCTAAFDPLSFFARGAWALGRIGWPVFKSCRSAYATAMSPRTVMHAWGALMAHARRTPCRREDVLARFDAFREARLDGPLGELHDLRLVLERVGRDWFQSPAGVESDVRSSLLRGLRGRAIDPDLEPSIARALCANLPTSFTQSMKRPEALEMFARTVPFIADAAPADLFLPRRYIEALLPAWTPSATAALVASAMQSTRTPARAVDRPGRNDLCSCRSGLKYKRCCALRSSQPMAMTG